MNLKWFEHPFIHQVILVMTSHSYVIGFFSIKEAISNLNVPIIAFRFIDRNLVLIAERLTAFWGNRKFCRNMVVRTSLFGDVTYDRCHGIAFFDDSKECGIPSFNSIDWQVNFRRNQTLIKWSWLFLRLQSIIWTVNSSSKRSKVYFTICKLDQCSATIRDKDITLFISMCRSKVRQHINI